MYQLDIHVLIDCDHLSNFHFFLSKQTGLLVVQGTHDVACFKRSIQGCATLQQLPLLVCETHYESATRAEKQANWNRIEPSNTGTIAVMDGARFTLLD